MKVKMVGTRLSNALGCTRYPRQHYAGHEMEGVGRGAQKNMEIEDSAKGNKRMRLDIENHHQKGVQQPTAVAFSCGSLLCHLGHEEE